MCVFFLGIKDLVISIWEKNPVHNSNNSVDIIINKIMSIGLVLKTPSELMTDMPAGTNKNPILFVKVVPTFSTSPSLIIPVQSAMNSSTNPITEAGIGIGIKLSIIFDTNIMIAITSAWWKK